MNSPQQQGHISSFNRPVFANGRQHYRFRLQQLLSEFFKDLTALNIRHLLLLFITATFIVLPVGSFIAAKVVVKVGDNLSQHRVVSLFMEPQSTQSHQSLKQNLLRYEQIQSVDIALQALEPALPGQSAVTVAEVVPSHHLTIKEVDQLVNQLQLIAGIEFVQLDNNQLIRNQKATRYARSVGFSIYLLSAALMALSIFLLIRKDIKSSSHQVQIRQKLGATRWQILQPHLLRGALLGLLAGIAGVGLALGLAPIADFVVQGTSFTIDTTVKIPQILLLTGFVIIIGSLSTSVAIKRFFYK